MARLVDHWGLVLTYGLVTIGLGLVLAVWPDETLKVLAILIGIQLIITGVFRMVLAVASTVTGRRRPGDGRPVRCPGPRRRPALPALTRCRRSW